MNKNLLILFGFVIVILVAVFFVFRGNSTKIKNYPPHDGPIIAFGDSLVAGTGSTDGKDFISLLSRKIGESIDNLGIPGDTTLDALDRINEALNRNPRIVIVLLGGNDFLRKVPHNITFTNLRSVVNKFQSRGAVVILLGVRSGLLFEGSGSEFSDLASAMGAAYVPDVLDGLFGDPRYMSDSVHPNDAGYALIADKVYPVLKSVLR